MIIARVIGNVVATRKDPKYEGTKLLLVQPLTLDGSPRGEALLAVDASGVDAGAGDKVLVVLEGWAAGYAIRKQLAPVDAAVIGVIDQVRLLSSA